MSKALTRNRRCNKTFDNYDDDHTILHSCLTSYGDPIKIIKLIGKGTFGEVFLADYVTKDGKKTSIAVKKIITKITTKNNLDTAITALTFEVEYSYDMASQNLGPEIYDAFYIITENNTYVVTYILMEAFDSSVNDAYSLKLPNTDYFYIHAQMLNILYKQIFDHHMYCSDIKPGNFVVKKIEGRYEVREIDFGTDWCKLNNFPLEYKNKEIFYVILLIQLSIMVMNQMSKYGLNLIVITPFFEDAIYNKYMNNTKNLKELTDVLTKVSKIYKVHAHYIVPALENIGLPLDPTGPKFGDDIIEFMTEYKIHIQSMGSTKSNQRSPRSPRRSVKVNRMQKTPSTKFLTGPDSMVWAEP